MEDIREELNLRYERLCEKERKSRREDHGNGGETALFAGGFKGRCHNCGKYGHKAANCKEKKDSEGGGGGGNNQSNSNGNGFKGKCYKCKKTGHKVKDCPENEKSGNDDTAEVALTAMEFGDCYDHEMTEGARVTLSDLDSDYDSIAEKVTDKPFGDFGETTKPNDCAHNFEESAIPNDFFDDWVQVGPEDDDASDDEIALVAFDMPVGSVPDTEETEAEEDDELAENYGKPVKQYSENDWAMASNLEGTNTVTRGLGFDSLACKSDDDESSGCPSLEAYDYESDSDSEAPIPVKRKVMKKVPVGTNDSKVQDEEDDDSSCPPLIDKKAYLNVYSDSDDSDTDLESSKHSIRKGKKWAPDDTMKGKTIPDIVLMANEARDFYEIEDDMWGECPLCGGQGIIGNYCDHCEDTGMIYQEFDERESEDDDEEESEDDSEEKSEEITGEPIDYNEQIENVTLQADLRMNQMVWIAGMRQIHQVNTIKEFLIQLPRWVADHRETTGETMIVASEMTQVLRHGIRYVEENAVTEFRRAQQDDTALPVIDGDIIDCETALEACVKNPKVKRYNVGYNDEILKNTWIADSGASTHMGNSDVGMTNVREVNSPVQIGNGKTLRATKIGDKHMTVLSKDGTMTDIVLKDYKYVPDLWVNLFAVTKCLRNGWKISNDGVTLILEEGSYGSEIR